MNKYEYVIHFRCPHHQREVHPAGVQQGLLHIEVVEMQKHRLKWAERLGIETVRSRAIRWRGLLLLKTVGSAFQLYLMDIKEHAKDYVLLIVVGLTFHYLG